MSTLLCSGELWPVVLSPHHTVLVTSLASSPTASPATQPFPYSSKTGPPDTSGSSTSGSPWNVLLPFGSSAFFQPFLKCDLLRDSPKPHQSLPRHPVHFNSKLSIIGEYLSPGIPFYCPSLPPTVSSKKARDTTVWLTLCPWCPVWPVSLVMC